MTDQKPEHNSIKERAKKKLERDMGPELLAALNDPKTVEIMLNADGKLWLERLGEPMKCIGTLRVAQAQAIIETIAGYHGKEVTRSKPILEGELPLDGSRFAGQLPPVVPAPTFAIRKKAVAIFTLDQYVERGIMTAAARGIDCSGARAPEHPCDRRHRLGQDHAGERDHQRDGDSRPDRAGFHHRGHRRNPVRRRELRPVPHQHRREHDGAAENHPPHAPRPNPGRRGARPRSP